jgi:hypothetical protein
VSEVNNSKLTEQINFAVTAETYAAAEVIERQTGIRITQLARAGFISEVQRYRHGVQPVDIATLRLVAEAQRLGINVQAELTLAMQRPAMPPAA